VLTKIVVSLFAGFDTFFSLLCRRDLTGVDAHCGESGGSIEEHSLYPWVCRLLKNMSTKYGVNQKHEHVDDISFRELCQSVLDQRVKSYR
jgi:hypothetical protein